jgi:hypothetical protein
MTYKQKRSAALKAGDTFYQPVKPCRRGHNAKRYTKTGSCTECMKARYAKEVKDPVRKQERLIASRLYYAAHKSDEDWMEARRAKALERWHIREEKKRRHKKSAP